MTDESATSVKLEKSKWTSLEESTLIDLVVEKEEILFGSLKGASSAESIRKIRQNTWLAITNQLNSRFLNAKKDVVAVKKKYANIKQRTKEKLDAKRKHQKQTGGGPQAPECSPAEEALLHVMQDRPVMVGFGGIDSDAIEQPSELLTNSTSTVKEQELKTTPVKDVTMCSRPKKKKTLKDKIDEANLKNIEMDNERLKNEIDLQEVTKQKLKLEVSMLKHKIIHIQLKLKAEFDVVVADEE